MSYDVDSLLINIPIGETMYFILDKNLRSREA